MRILIADDQDRVRFALRVLLAQQLGLLVIGEVSDVQGLLAEAGAGEPDVALVDWELPGLRELGGLAALRSLCPTLQIVVLSSRLGVRQVAKAAGIDAFVSKADPPEHLLSVVRTIGETAK
jgi:DNA-binding NarL/FixJ family response regulator